ncbi:CAAX protease [Subtercola sp. Z020]|uniref:Abi family protein n=1 Tax=Subtercola sp. Z020 TaxID=2080582 RepID=UPI000CE8300E|nr:Abi family protein [Subtercola sp. Z020]PPF78907.1 CAAX protease [Subtercola sp. Z020]
MAQNLDSTGWVEEWLSAGRFTTYLSASGGDRNRALALYEWNAQLSAAFLHDLSHLEVGLRNACDRALQRATVAGEFHWTDARTLSALFPITARRNRASGLQTDSNRIPRENFERARAAAASTNGLPPVPGKVIAELMFGFWTFLVADSHEKTVWVPHLYKAFPSGTDRRRLNTSLASLRTFRNRVAHHENILRGSEDMRRRIVYLVRLLSEEASAHLQAHSEVGSLLRQRP